MGKSPYGGECPSPAPSGPEIGEVVPYHQIPAETPTTSEEIVSVKHENKSKMSQKKLFVFIGIFITLSVVSYITRKLMMNAYGTKFAFIRQIMTNLFYDIYATIAIVYKLIWTSDITPEMRRYPYYKFALLAFLDGLGDFLGTVGGVGTPGSWQVLILQLAIPCTMVIAYFVLAQRFVRLQLFGAFVIVTGAILAITPLFTENGKSHHAVWYSVIIFATSNIPASFSSIYKEVAFKAISMDVFWLTGIVSWTQVVLSWFFVPILSLHSFGGISLDEIPSTSRDGLRCFIGDENIEIHRDGKVAGHCSSYTTRVTMIYSICAFFNGIAMLLVLKHGSASLVVLCQGVALPLSNLAFSVHFIMGSQVEPFSWFDVGGLVLVLIGFILYNFRSLFSSADDEDDISPSSSEYDSSIDSRIFSPLRHKTADEILIVNRDEPSEPLLSRKKEQPMKRYV